MFMKYLFARSVSVMLAVAHALGSHRYWPQDAPSTFSGSISWPYRRSLNVDPDLRLAVLGLDRQGLRVPTK